MNLYQTRILLPGEGRVAARGSRTTTMVHHAEFPTDGNAAGFGAEVAIEMQDDDLSRRWVATRGTDWGACEVVTYGVDLPSGHLEEVHRAQFDLPAFVTLDLPDLLELPGMPADLQECHLYPDPSRGITVTAYGSLGGEEVRGRAYVGPVAPIGFYSRWEVGISIVDLSIGTVFFAWPGHDAPPSPEDEPGLWTPEFAEAGAQWCKSLNNIAVAHGGYSVVRSRKYGVAVPVTRWRSSRVPYHLRNRGWRTTMGAGVLA